MIALLEAAGAMFSIAIFVALVFIVGEAWDARHGRGIDAQAALYPTTSRNVHATPVAPPVREVQR